MWKTEGNHQGCTPERVEAHLPPQRSPKVVSPHSVPATLLRSVGTVPLHTLDLFELSGWDDSLQIQLRLVSVVHSHSTCSAPPARTPRFSLVRI